MTDKWTALEKNMSDSPGLLVSQEPVKELIAQVRRLKAALQRLVSESVKEFGPSTYNCALNQARAALKEKLQVSDRPSRRQIVFNWIMGEDLANHDGYWGGSDGVKAVDELLAALDEQSESRVRELE